MIHKLLSLTFDSRQQSFSPFRCGQNRRRRFFSTQQTQWHRDSGNGGLAVCDGCPWFRSLSTARSLCILCALDCFCSNNSTCKSTVPPSSLCLALSPSPHLPQKKVYAYASGFWLNTPCMRLRTLCVHVQQFIVHFPPWMLGAACRANSL